MAVDKSQEVLDKLIEALEGTSNALEETCESLEIELPLTPKDHEYIDSEIFCCESCGWWYNIDCKVEEYCDNCEDESEDDEDYEY